MPAHQVAPPAPPEADADAPPWESLFQRVAGCERVAQVRSEKEFFGCFGMAERKCLCCFFLGGEDKFGCLFVLVGFVWFG